MGRKEEIEIFIESLSGELSCKMDHRCISGDISKLCKVKDTGLDSYVVCLEENHKCGNYEEFGGGYFCKCPVRIHIARNYENT